MLGFTDRELEALLAAWMLPFLRVAALFSSAPILSHRAFPVRLRLAAALAITAAIAGTIPGPPPRGEALAFAAAEQVLVGLALGFTLQLVFAAAQLAGEVIGLQMGLGFATFFDPGGATQTPMPGAFITVAAFLLFLALDGHLVMIGTVAESFRDLPPGELLGRFDPQAMARAGGSVFRLGLQLALAPLVGLLLVNFAFGLVARVSPQLNIFSVGFPAALLAGFVLLVLAAPAWLRALENALRAALAALVH